MAKIWNAPEQFFPYFLIHVKDNQIFQLISQYMELENLALQMCSVLWFKYYTLKLPSVLFYENL